MNDKYQVIWAVPVKDVPQTGGEIQNKYYYQGLLDNRSVELLNKERISFKEAIGYVLNSNNKYVYITDSYYRNRHILFNWLFIINKRVKKVCFVWRPYHSPVIKSPKGWFSYCAFWLYFRPCDTIFVNSRATGRWVNNIIEDKKIVICQPSPSICGTYVKRPRKDKVKLLLVGYFTSIKGQTVLLESLKHLTEYKWEVTLIGGIKDHSYFNEVKQTIAARKWNEKVEILTNASKEQMIKAYQEADIYVQSSLEEGYGMAIAEAMTFGLPVIGSNTGGIPEVVEDGVNGYLVRPGDREDLKSKIEMLVKDYDKRSLLGENSSKKAKTFIGWQQNADRFVEEVLRLHKIQ